MNIIFNQKQSGILCTVFEFHHLLLTKSPPINCTTVSCTSNNFLKPSKKKYK